MTVKQNLRQKAKLAKWRWFTNIKGSVSYRLTPSGKTSNGDVLKELRREGIFVGDAGGAGLLYMDELNNEANRIIALPETQAAIESQKIAVSDGKDDYKDFLLGLIGSYPSLDIDSPIIKFCTQPALLQLVNNYMGMWCSLRYVDMWMNFPTTSESAKDTQMFHCDGDDVMNVKLFIYLCDVDEKTGPFTFIAGTHPIGDRRVKLATNDGRATDEDMARLVPEADWRLCVGPSGTMVLADTCGWHRGLKPTHNIRTLFTCQFTSMNCAHPRGFELTGSPSNTELTREQRYALRLGSA